MLGWVACLVIFTHLLLTGALSLARDKVTSSVAAQGTPLQSHRILPSVKVELVKSSVTTVNKTTPVTMPSNWQCHSYVNGQSNDWCSKTRFEGGYEFLFTAGKFSKCGDCWCCKRVVAPHVAAHLKDQATMTTQHEQNLNAVPRELIERQIKVEGTQQQAQEAFPKIIHQTWKDTKLPQEFERWSRSWKECLPDWEYKLHTDEDNRELIKNHFPDFLQTYDSYDAPIKRVDAARYAYLATEGGLYVDLDIECVRDPRGLFDMALSGEDGTTGRADIILSWEAYSNDGQLSNAFMLALSDKGRSFYKKAFEKLPQTALDYVLDATGPSFLTRRVEEYLADKSTVQDGVQKLHSTDAYYRPLFGSVKTLNKLGTKIAVADDALIFNIPWYDLDDKQNCANSAWCREHYPYALSVSHWSSSWLPEINTVSAGGSKDFVRTYTLDDKKCSKGSSRIFKIVAAELPGEVDVLDVCGKACIADPECKFFGLLRQQWCMGCKEEPTDTHDGFESYRLAGRIVSNKNYDKLLDSYSSDQKFSRVYSLDGRACGTEDHDRLFQMMDVPKGVDELAYCSLACEYNPDCNFFSLMKGHWCMGCSAAPNNKQAAAIQTYRISGKGDVADDLPQESVHSIHSRRGSSESGVFSRAFALDNKKCSTESSDRLFRIDGFDGEAEQVFRCSEACAANPECKYFTVEVKSRMCIGCKTHPSEDAEGFWAYKWMSDGNPATNKSMVEEKPVTHESKLDAKRAAHKSMTDEDPAARRPTRSGHDLAPLIQAGEAVRVHRSHHRSNSIQTFRSKHVEKGHARKHSQLKMQQVCTCFSTGLSGTPSVMCQKSLRQQLGHFRHLSHTSSSREVYRALQDLHLRWC